jgi:hypothetical protein
MEIAAERRAVTAEVFAATGKKCADDDPIIIAALFQAQTIRGAGQEAVEQIAQAAEALMSAVESASKVAANAEAIAQHAAADRKAFANTAATERRALADAVEARLKKSYRDLGGAQSTQEGIPTGWRGVLAGAALGFFMAVALLSIACNFNSSLLADARLGAEWKQVFPALPPALRNQLLEHFEKQHR